MGTFDLRYLIKHFICMRLGVTRNIQDMYNTVYLQFMINSLKLHIPERYFLYLFLKKKQYLLCGKALKLTFNRDNSSFFFFIALPCDWMVSLKQ